MKHLFATSFSMLGELMQNARRSGATFVNFTFDPALKTLEITDDGCGIKDFGKLLALCDSGWDEQTTLTDTPFGMGFFSVFFACERVTIRSNGLKLQATLADIASKRKLKAVADTNPVNRGAVIHLEGLSKDLLGTKLQYFGPAPETGVYKLQAQLFEYAMGFPIDVQFNGDSLPRPHALENLKTTLTLHGHVHITHIMGGSTKTAETRLFMESIATKAPYLQGLPIQVRNETRANTVVHLSGHRFVALMPDRKALYNAEVQLDELRLTLRSLVQQFLVTQKATVPPEGFVAKYWDACMEYGVASLLNDIPLLPRSILFTIDIVAMDEHVRTGCDGEPFVTRDQIVKGEVKVWRDAPQYSDQPKIEQVGAIWKVMQIDRIHEVKTDGIDQGHWIFGSTPSVADFKATIAPTEMLASENIYVEGSDVEVRFVDSVEVCITSAVESTFEHKTAVVDNWIMEAVDKSELEARQGFI